AGDDGLELRPVALFGRMPWVADVDETGDALVWRQAQPFEDPSVIGIPLRDPTGSEAHGIGGVHQIHRGGAGRKLLLPFRDLHMWAGAADHRNNQRRTRQSVALEFDLLGRGVRPFGAEDLRNDFAGGM